MSTLTEEDKDTSVLVDRGIAIVLYNDDYNTFDHVISCLVKYCKHDILQAEQCAHIVHNNGRCSVKYGSRDELQAIYEALIENGLTVKIQYV